MQRTVHISISIPALAPQLIRDLRAVGLAVTRLDQAADVVFSEHDQRFSISGPPVLEVVGFHKTIKVALHLLSEKYPDDIIIVSGADDL